MPHFISSTSSSKRKASRSPDTRLSKRAAPSTPEEGEVDDGGPSNPPPHFSLPAKPVSTENKKGKIAFPFKTKKTQVETTTTTTNVFSEAKPSAGKASPGRGRTRERTSEGTRHLSRDSDVKERRNGRGTRALMRASQILLKSGRSAWKGPYFVAFPNLKEALNNHVAIKTQARSCTVLPNFVGIRFLVHNGKDYVPVLVTQDMVGHKLGEFSHTKKAFSYKKK